ncbi:MAG: ATP-binding cassette domain-containing protein [Spirochaetaceae bacterium]|nr:MAG: ATP-binding cassette domain-containing protein [Spirochaetaceae bacterium]
MSLMVKSVTKRMSSEFELSVRDFALSEGICSVTGPNGSGKSTFLLLAAGLWTSDSGTILVGSNDRGLSVRSSGAKRLIGSFVSERQLVQFLSPIEYVTFACELFESPVTRPQIESALDRVGVDATDAKRYLRELSAGTKAKVGAAAALVRAPTLLILDEIVDSIDEQSWKHVASWIQELSAHGSSVVLISSQNASRTRTLASMELGFDRGVGGLRR